MTAEEKAKDLVRSYQFKLKEVGGYTFKLAKEISVFNVEEIIKACEYNDVEVYNTDWWNRVRDEIKLL